MQPIKKEIQPGDVAVVQALAAALSRLVEATEDEDCPPPSSSEVLQAMHSAIRAAGSDAGEDAGGPAAGR